MYGSLQEDSLGSPLGKFTESAGAQGPKGPIGPLKKVASLRETARLDNPKIAKSLQNVCQKLTKSWPK